MRIGRLVGAMVVGSAVGRVVLVLRELVDEVKEALDSAGCEFGEMDLDEDVRYPIVWEAIR